MWRRKRFPRLSSVRISIIKSSLEYMKRPDPVLLKGFAEDTPAVKKWSVDWVVENFGNEKALTKTLLGDNIPGRVKDINTPGTYLHNCEVTIFVNHPSSWTIWSWTACRRLFRRMEIRKPTFGEQPSARRTVADSILPRTRRYGHWLPLRQRLQLVLHDSRF